MTLARLRAGEVFGEMSLINNQPTSASVRAARRSTILFLARDYFQRLVEALPEIRQYFQELSERRGLESQLVLGGEAVEVAGTRQSIRVRHESSFRADPAGPSRSEPGRGWVRCDTARVCRYCKPPTGRHVFRKSWTGRARVS